jgi:hypothetical protein
MAGVYRPRHPERSVLYRLLGALCRSALRSLTRYFEVVTGSELMPGVIAAIQTFGNRINAHPHLHFLVTEGGVDKAGLFHKIPRLDDSRLAELFAREVLGFLVRKELLSPEWADRLLSWRHTGFNVHSRVRAKTKAEAERVGKYMIPPLLSLERLSFSEKEGQVCYRYGKDGQEMERLDYLEFIARVTSHIPDKGQVTVRYYGSTPMLIGGRSKRRVWPSLSGLSRRSSGVSLPKAGLR